MGNSSSKNKQKKQRARAIASAQTNHSQNQQPPLQQHQQYVPDYRKPEPEHPAEDEYDDYDDQDLSDNMTSQQDWHADIDSCISRLLAVGQTKHIGRTFCLTEAEVIAICHYAYNIFLGQPTLLELSPGVKVVGDIHGQYHDLMRLFQMSGFPPSSNYLFLGDYVDRGMYSLETIFLLLCFKIKFPENFFLLRGNHESADVTRVYGFYDECKRRMSIKIWKHCVNVFNSMPIAALVGGRIFCLHGGLSPFMKSLDQIISIQRPVEIPEVGLLNDLLWSDPSDASPDWSENDRGVSICFGTRNVDDFLNRFDLDLVCRAHMVVEDGYEFFNQRKLVTIFSAPNYCGEFDNYGAVMTISSDLLCSFELLPPEEKIVTREQIRKKNSLSFQLPAA